MKKLRGFYPDFSTLLSALVIMAFTMTGTLAAVSQTAPQILPYTATTAAGQLGVTTNPGAVPPITTGDGGSATSATFTNPRGVAVDAQGNIYIADTGNNLVRKVNAVTGIISVVAGGGTGTVTNNAVATSVALNGPRGVSVDASGNVWITESGGNRIDEVTPDGLLHIMVRSSSGGFGGDGTAQPISGTTYVIYNPEDSVIDSNGDLYIADTGNCVIRKLSGGIITTVVGKTPDTAGVPVKGTKCTAYSAYKITPDPAASGVDCKGPNAPYLGQPYDVAVDRSGNIFFADSTAYKVRVCFANDTTRGGKTYLKGKIYTIVGTGNGCTTTSAGCSLFANSTGAAFTGFGPIDAATADIGHPVGLKADSLGNLYISDSTNSVVWYYDFDSSQIRVVAGYGPQKPATTPTGWYYQGPYRTTCDNVDLHIPTTDPKYASTYGDGCPASWAKLSSPQRIALDPAGNLYVVEQGSTSDSGGNVVRKILSGTQFQLPPAAPVNVGSSTAGLIQLKFASGDAASTIQTGSTEFAVDPTCAKNPDGSATASDICVVSATFTPSRPGTVRNSLSVETANKGAAHFALVGKGQGAVAAIDPGIVNLFPSTWTDAQQQSVEWKNPQAIAIDQSGNYYVADATSGVVTKNSTQILANLNGPRAVAVDALGNVYVADTGNGQLLKIDAITGNSSTLLTQLNGPLGVAVDFWGNVYVSDTGNNQVRRIDALTGQSVVAVGGGTGSCSGSCTPMQATLNAPAGLAVNGAGALFIADQGSKSIQKADFAANLISNVGGSLSLTAPVAVAVDPAGDLYVSDAGAHAVTMIDASKNASVLLGLPGSAGSDGADGEVATNFLLNTPGAVVVDHFGSVYVADGGNKRILHLDRSAGLLAFNPLNPGAVSAVANAVFSNVGNVALNPSTPCYTESNPGAYQITFGCGSAVNPGTTNQLAVRFAPTDFLVYPNSITFNNDSIRPVQLSLYGQGGDLVATTTTVTLNPAQAVYTQSVAVNVSVTMDGGTPEGSVACFGSPKVPLVNGSATITLNGVPVGDSNLIECSYTPAANTTFASSSGSATLTVTKADTTTSMQLFLADGKTLAPSSLAQYQSVCMIATSVAKSPASGQVTINADVQFKNGSTILGTSQVDSTGHAKFCTGTDPTVQYPPLLPVGTANLVAVFDPNKVDASFNTSTASASISVTTATPEFTIVPTQTSLTVPAGGQASQILTITPVNYPLAQVDLKCENLPAYAWCTFVPNAIQFTDNVTDTNKQALFKSPVKVGFYVTTNTASIAQLQPRTFGPLSAALALLCPGIVIGGIGLMTGSRRRKSLRAKMLFLLALTAITAMIAGGLIGCGGSLHKVDASTPAGTFNVKVIATFSQGASATHSVVIPVTIQ